MEIISQRSNVFIIIFKRVTSGGSVEKAKKRRNCKGKTVIGYNFDSLSVKSLCAHAFSHVVLPLVVLVLNVCSNC